MANTVWGHAGPSILTAFLASAVEFVQALIVTLAVGSVRGWRDALCGAGTALGVLLLLVVTLGTALTRMPLDVLQLVVGALLLMFGLRWLRKAVLRSAGVIPLHDETAAFARQSEAMRRHEVVRGWDRVAFGASFQITLLEGAEVVFIVVAIGAGSPGMLLPASLGALAALACVAALGVAIHRPLARVPENALKFMVGVLLSAFGSSWAGEGMGVAWPGGDRAILILVPGFLAIALVAVAACRARVATRRLAHERA